jgi:ATP-dependent Lon protease
MVAILSTVSSGRVTQRLLATPRVGLKTVILPSHNEKDLDDLPEEVREGMTFILVGTMDEVLKAALGDGFDRAACE